LKSAPTRSCNDEAIHEMFYMPLSMISSNQCDELSTIMNEKVGLLDREIQLISGVHLNPLCENIFQNFKRI
jgi:hypothetical protein